MRMSKGNDAAISSGACVYTEQSMCMCVRERDTELLVSVKL